MSKSPVRGASDRKATAFKILEAEQQSILPPMKARFHYERALNLFQKGMRTSIELERVIKEVVRAVYVYLYHHVLIEILIFTSRSKQAAFLPKQTKHYMLLGAIYTKALDLTSAIYSYRYVLFLKPDFYRAKMKLYNLLVLNGLELMEYADKVLLMKTTSSTVFSILTVSRYISSDDSLLKATPF